MSALYPKDSHLAVGDLRFFDIAEALVETEAQEWGEEVHSSLLLDETLAILMREAERGATRFASRTGERARIWTLCGKWSEAAALKSHYEEVARHADVWILGVADAEINLPGVVAVPVPKGSALERERAVIVDSPSFGGAVFACDGGLLDEANAESHFYEGVVTTHPEAIEIAAGRLCALLKLSPFSHRWNDADLGALWITRLVRRLLETSEVSRLELRARQIEVKKLQSEHERLQSEHERLEKMVRSYVGGATWQEAQRALGQNRDSIADREREELTICFCDLVGFSKLSERLTPAEVAHVLNDHFARLYNIVRGHGGTVDKFIGDAILASFPEPAEAFLAAKRMVQESRAVRLKADWELPIQVRVGLNTGPVAVANLGVEEMRQFTVLGEAVNFAQRMQSAAPPHAVLMSERTMRALPPMSIRQLEPIKVEIKGRREPVEAYLWTTSHERVDEVSDRLGLRGSLLNLGSRPSLSERFKRS